MHDLIRLSGLLLDIALGVAALVIAVVMITAATAHDIEPDRGPPALAYLATCPVEL